MDRAAAARLWPFESQGIYYLNHGSFGATPLPVQQAEDAVRQRLRNNPFDHLVYEQGGLWNQAGFGLMEQNRRFLADLVGAESDGFVLTQCATDGVNAVFRSLQGENFFRPGDEILLTSFGYNACNNVAALVAAQTGAVVRSVDLPFPLEDSAQILNLIADATTDRTRFAMVDHISSATAIVLPIEAIVQKFRERGIPILVDGAHGLGQVPLALDALGADFYVGNAHKWFCAPPGVGFLSVAERWRDRIRPTILSHGYNDPGDSLPPLIKMFGWTGTKDYTAQLVLRDAWACLSSLAPGGVEEVMRSNHDLVMQGRELLLGALEQTAPVPEEMMGAMATVFLPEGDALAWRESLRKDHGFVLQILPQAVEGRSILRISAHAYNTLPQYEKLAKALPKVLFRPS